ncbi:MAG: Tim44 domain-containing protein [Alphaproteobacteria bacterium]|nr:Tim44 domain-containing protein [Alphaproteobacteria bacterium]MBV9370453.1 Tim44 domain-containing protein [Alphaproteobacteria bacterium]MBV9900037.1 Tim44 domain-containing protein [Alphaproteobacteria bacterium]
MTEIVLLALVALFVGLRLYSVLGRRTGHEQQPILRPAESAAAAEAAPAVAEKPVERPESSGFVYEEPATAGIRAIVSADSSFDVGAFLEGAQSAYRMILEAFWKGDRAELRQLVGGHVLEAFEAAIDEREASGHRLDNRLVAIERTIIEDARLSAGTAEIEVRFDADIAAVTRDADGNLVAGTLTDAVPTHDLWTFRRALGSRDPNWLLVDTDQAD